MAKTLPIPRRRTRGTLAPTYRNLYVLSDSTGSLARHMLGVYLTQFPAGTLTPHFEPFIRTQARLQEVLTEAQEAGAAICHAMVSPEFKRSIKAFCTRAGIPCRDLTGGTAEFLAEISGVSPTRDVDALHRLDDSYKRRIGAMEFTLAHDDGLGAETLAQADVVLVGVSRTSKTPTSIYLALLGYRVANIALAMEVAPPTQLLTIPPNKVVGLLIDPEQLVMIRRHRETGWNASAGDYGDPHHVVRELEWARRLYNDHGWKTLNVTDRAIEETAALVIELIGLPTTNPRSDSFVDLE